MVNEVFPNTLPEDSKHTPIVSRQVLCSEMLHTFQTKR
jgi:hypothetical protein